MVKKPKGHGPYNSKREREVMKLLNKILPKEERIDNGYYSWLISPHGTPMQLDRFYPKLDVAIEVDGRQHSQYSSYFHSSYDAFLHQKACDRVKNALCKEKGVTLIRIRHDVLLSEEYLVRRLKRAGVKL